MPNSFVDDDPIRRMGESADEALFAKLWGPAALPDPVEAAQKLVAETLLKPPTVTKLLDDDSGLWAPVVVRSSFGYKKTDGTSFHVYRGQVRWSGRPAFSLPENDVMNVVTITGGSVEAPGCVCLRIPADTGPAGTTLVFLTAQNPPDDDGSFIYKPLWEAYLVDGNAVKGQDRRTDFSMGSPI